VELDGRVALVTGAARRVGRGIALALAGGGAHVVVHYGTSAADAAETAAAARGLGVDAEAMQADLTDPIRIAALFQGIQRRFGRLDVAVNSAASFVHRPFDRIGADEWDRVMAINLRAPFLCTQHAARLMGAAQRDGPPGLVVNLADLGGVHAWRGCAHHAVSKAGLLHLTRVAARELAPCVRVNAIVPGAVLPPPGMDPDGEAWLRLSTAGPLRARGTPEDVAGAVVFLAASDFITGVALSVDGGAHLTGPAGTQGERS